MRGGGVRSEGVRSEGVRSEGVRRREDGSVAGSRAARERGSRFPEILTLPALVGTRTPPFRRTMYNKHTHMTHVHTNVHTN